MKLWKWQPGRQHGCEYEKFPLWFFRIGRWGFDAYILRYKPHTTLNWHTDPIKGSHWRWNYKLKGLASFFMKRGGQLICVSKKKSVFFRPDIYLHKLEVHQYGCTKLSVGFAKFDK